MLSSRPLIVASGTPMSSRPTTLGTSPGRASGVPCRPVALQKTFAECTLDAHREHACHPACATSLEISQFQESTRALMGSFAVERKIDLGVEPRRNLLPCRFQILDDVLDHLVHRTGAGLEAPYIDDEIAIVAVLHSPTDNNDLAETDFLERGAPKLGHLGSFEKGAPDPHMDVRVSLAIRPTVHSCVAYQCTASASGSCSAIHRYSARRKCGHAERTNAICAAVSSLGRCGSVNVSSFSVHAPPGPTTPREATLAPHSQDCIA